MKTIKEFAYQKLRFQKYQQVNALLSYLLLVTVIIVLPKFFMGKTLLTADIFGLSHFLLFIYSYYSSQNE